MSSVNEIREFYSNDIVYRFDKRRRINFGVVVDSYESSSTDSDDTVSLKKGQIRVSWLNSFKETVWKQTKVRLMSRSIIPGDIVRRLENGKETQRGYCKESKQYVTVQIIGTDKIIERITGDRLISLYNFDINVPVCLGKKYGRIQSIDEKITMKSKCGSVVEFLSSINTNVEDYWVVRNNRNFFDNFYPGQEVTCTPINIEQPNWVSKSKSMKRNLLTKQRFTVQKVEPTDLEVAWFDSMTNSTVATVKASDIKKIKSIQLVEYAHLDLAERRLMKLNPSDVISKKNNWIRKLSTLHQDHHKVVHIVNRNAKKNRKSQLRHPSLVSTCVNPNELDEGWFTEDEDDVSDIGSSSSSLSVSPHSQQYPPKVGDVTPGSAVAVEVLCMESKVTIVWQDGSEEKDIPTTQLYYSISLDDHEFFPGEWVVKSEESETTFGVIQFVNHLQRTAMVKWYENSESGEKPILKSTEEVSVYDLTKHTKYAFRPGSIVKRIPLENDKIGTVLDSYPEGHIVVHWIDNVEEQCWPTNLELIPESIDYDYSGDENEDSAQLSWETESVESIVGDVNDESTLQNMAIKLDFVRSRLSHLRDVLKSRSNKESFCLLKELLTMYDNSSYLDKLLDTSFFSLKSRHFQMLLSQIKEKAKSFGVELRGRLFSTVENLGSAVLKTKHPDKENINKVLKMEHKMNINMDAVKEDVAEAEEKASTPATPDSDNPLKFHENICVELISMMKARMDLAYAEIVSRIGGPQALSVMTLASSSTLVTSTPISSLPTTPEETPSNLTTLKLPKSVINCESNIYNLVDEVHSSHRFYSSKFEPVNKGKFLKAIQKEFKLLKDDLPPGVWVKSYANRMDLLSVMIAGPSKTPYEDGLFLFDLQLRPDYPETPPICHYISYNSERLNPNLYVEGKVCISLLGTWMGRGNEMWNSDSTLLQLIVSIQGLILVSEPYYNEAGYEKQMTSQQGYENSRTYNELVILKLVQSMTEMLKHPSEIFKIEILEHFKANGEKLCERLQNWCNDSDPCQPEFPLLPVSKGLTLSLNAALKTFKDVLKNVCDS